jgi:hypothetical protein
MAYNTVRKFARAGSPDALLSGSWESRATIPDPFETFLHQRWNDGQRTIAQLHTEIKKEGHRGSYGTVYAYLRSLRDAGITPPVTPGPPKVRHVAGWIMTNPDNLPEEETLRRHSQRSAPAAQHCTPPEPMSPRSPA